MFNAAIIGSGIGLKHLEAMNGYRSVKVRIICEKDKKRALYLKKKFTKLKITDNENEIFKDKSIKLVSIASYDNYHYRQIVKCIKHNKHIIVEKPFCLNLKELIDIYKLLKKNRQIKFLSNLVLRVNDLFKNIKKIVKPKNIYYLEADYIWGRKEKLLGWRANIKNYSATLGAGIHLIDLSTWILKKKPISVISYGNSIATNKTKFKENSFVINLFKFPGNVLLKITSNLAGNYEHFHELKIFEKNKTIIHNLSHSFIIDSKKNKKNLKGNYPDKFNRKKLIQNFIDQIKDTSIKPILTLKEQFDLMSICFYADKSLKSRKEVKIRYL
jgi:predicted dehydrogenase